MLVTFSGQRCVQLPGAQYLLTRSAAAIAGLVGAMHEAKRVRDMRKYPFWARSAEIFENMQFIAPRKILRDSPTRRDTPQKIGRKNVRLVFWLVTFWSRRAYRQSADAAELTGYPIFRRLMR